MNLHIGPPRLRFEPIPTASFTVATGAAGYVDTDVSATTGTLTSRIWLITAFKNGNGEAGARAHGSAVDSRVTLNNTSFLMSRVDSLGHMDLLRDAAADIVYQFSGYLE